MIRRVRGSGPGGQRRNKVETGAHLTHRPTGQIVEATERRSFEDNRKIGLHRLRLALAVRHREPAAGSPTRAPTDLWRRRTGGPRLAVAAEHEDVPALLAEALDRLAACDDDPVAAAEQLGVTRTRLVRLLQLHPPALAALNARRVARGERPLR